MNGITPIRDAYLRKTVQDGEFPTGCEDAFFDTYIPKFRKFLHRELPLSSPRKLYVNHFMLGADPEFMFMQDGEKVPADHYGMKTGTFCGADNNGRLVELRPFPSTSALEVLASILASLRLMAVYYPTTLSAQWTALPFVKDDGLGGHVHFGRKAATRPKEVTALDSIAKAMMHLNIFDTKLWNRRRAGDKFNQRYGEFADYRLQKHGYEYRTLPSWMGSPWLAFFCITASKLAVLDPWLVQPWFERETFSKDLFFNLFGYFKGKDDDAWLAYETLKKKGLPIYHGGDFKAAWGISQLKTRPVVAVLPTFLKPTDSEIQQVFDHLAGGKPLTMECPKTRWIEKLPPGGYSLLDTHNTSHNPGLGELLVNFIGHQAQPVTIGCWKTSAGYRYALKTTEKAWKVCNKELLLKFIPKQHIYVAGMDGSGIGLAIAQDWRKNPKKADLMKRALTSGAFPLWDVKNLPPTLEWNTPKEAQPSRKVYGKQVEVIF